MKQLRHQQIREIVERHDIRTQHELAAALRGRGFRVTQATVSRDIAEIGLVKVGRRGGTAYSLPTPAHGPEEMTAEQRLRELLSGLPVEVRRAGLLLVIRAVPGSAHAIAAALDRCRWPEVVGSLAGDDTLFVAFADAAALERVRMRLLRATEQ
ncbi:MAG: arginine repressor [Chloroflexota bacterium]|nr:arginine repressor [Chloroflexota bacterium]